jgi:CheY-like chemotaxis protein
VLDEESCRRHGTLQPGRFVRLAVSDNGTGMSEEARAHLFEPFFTTKAPGQGTGLGLPMVYGAVSQNGGSVEVYTELGHGTTFRIYLPLVDQPVEAPAPAVQGTVSGGEETILLVEDHELVRGFAVRLLRRKGYRVHPFANGQEALQGLAALPARPDLLITDVVMPGIDGKALAESVRAACPGVRVLFTSGFTANVIVHHGVLERGVEFLPKPYSAEELLRRVREVLEATAQG